MNEEQPAAASILRLAVLFEGGLLVIAVFLGGLLNRAPLDQIRVTSLAVLYGALATVPLLIGMWWCARSRFRPLQELMRQVELQILPLFAGASGTNLLVISVLAGLGEECLFRGVLQPELAGWVGLPLALALTSVLFGLAHFVTPTYAVVAGVIGAYLGGVAVLSDNLLVPIVSHAAYDFAALKFLTSTSQTGARIQP